MLIRDKSTYFTGMMQRNMKKAGFPDAPGEKGLFLSGDWGTSSLRIRLVNAATGQVIAEDTSGNGIRQTFFSWKQTHDDRISFYLDVLGAVLRNMEKELGLSLRGIPLVLSGMASSSAGMLELPYMEIPYDLYKDDLITEWLPADDDNANPVLLVSGLKSGDDVMRGEETQLIGCLPEAAGSSQDRSLTWGGQERRADMPAGTDQDHAGVEPLAKTAGDGAEAEKLGQADGLYIFPGTHSKHILVKDGTVTAFTTYMTGEIFELLAEKSLLAGSVEKSQEKPGERQWDSFRRGVKAAAGANFLQAAFQTRINDLFGRLPKKENFYYLSGLLIGIELQSLPGSGAGDVYLCCGHGLKDHYEKALETVAICKRVHIFPAGWVDKAAIRGQWAILSGIKPT